MDVKEASKRAKEAIDRMTWKKDPPLTNGIKEGYSGNTDDGWISAVCRTDGKTSEGRFVPIYDGVASNIRTGVMIHLTEEQAEHAMYLARKQLEKH